MKKILVLNGSFSEQTIIETAKKLGFYVVTTGNQPDLVGHKSADEYIPADYSNGEAVLEIVKNNGIEGVVSCANDFGSITASYVAEKMGWTSHDSYQTALTLHHKDKFKAFLEKEGIRCAHSESFTDIEAAKNYAKTCEYPIIAKANDLTGGKGILRANNYEEAVFAIDNAFNRSRSKHIVIEPYLIGIQQSFDSFLINGKVVSYVSNNTFQPINPYLIQSETLPAEGVDKIKDEMIGIAEHIAKALDLKDGILGLQHILVDGKPYIMETMKRCFGNQFLTLATMITGFPWEEAYVRAALGMDMSAIKTEEPKVRFCGHHGIMATKNGIVKSCVIPPEIEKHIFKRIDMLKPGDRLNDYMNERIAYIYYTYDSEEEMNAAVAKYNDMIKTEIEED